MRRIAATVVGLALAIFAGPLTAQDTVQVIVRDTVQLIVEVPTPAAIARPGTPEFRRGQWAGMFSVGYLAYGVGALRFSGPDKAWNYFGTVSLLSEDSGPDRTSVGLGLQIGRRTYGAPRGRVRSFRQFGGQVGFGRQTFDAGAGESSQTNYSIGAHALVGATVFVAQDLSIGAEWQAYGNYFVERDQPSAGDSETSDGWSFSVGYIALTGAFYF